MEISKAPQVHTLSLTYIEYVKSGRSIANSRIGKYVIQSQLGRGAFGAVYKGMDDQTKRFVAIKVLDLQAVQREPNPRVKQIRRRLCASESKLMMICNSENVVKCYDVYENKSLKIIVMQYCNGGDLHAEISAKGKIPQKEAILILKHLVNGIAELHTHKIIHRDLKAENVLSHNGVYKIADLGFSKQQLQQGEIGQTTLGTITTMAPEVMKKQPYGLKADIWSLGIIFFQMVFGKVPYTSTNAILMLNQIQTKKILNTEQFQYNGHKASKEVTKFLREIICVDKTKRLGWKQLINHQIFGLQSENLANEFRLNCELIKPAIKLDDQIENEDQVEQSSNKYPQIKYPSLQPGAVDKMAHMLIRLTQNDVDIKMTQIRKDQDQLYSWVKDTHLECLKTQLIYNQIFEVIEKNKLLDLQEREVVQFLYLILTRCLNNISVINDKISHEKNSPLLTKQLQSVKSLYNKITKSWKRYSEYLTEHQNKVGSIIGDRFRKIFSSKSMQTKDRFLTGIQKIQYSKEEQIKFTDEEYIKPLSDQISGQSNQVKKLKRFLKHYVKINSIKLTDLKQKTFLQHIEMILQ